MPSAPLPADEKSRQTSLEASGLSRFRSDPVLETAVRQAADLFDTPIATITLLDASLQRFVAAIGLDIPETPRDCAFCGYAILEVAPLVVLDAQADSRFADNPLVIGRPDIRFYAGVPVYGTDGASYGALCVIDTQARASVDPAQVAALVALAGEVTARFARLSVAPSG